MMFRFKLVMLSIARRVSLNGCLGTLFCARVCMCVRECAYARVPMCMCERACVHAFVCISVCVCVHCYCDFCCLQISGLAQAKSHFQILLISLYGVVYANYSGTESSFEKKLPFYGYSTQFES